MDLCPQPPPPPRTPNPPPPPLPPSDGPEYIEIFVELIQALVLGQVIVDITGLGNRGNNFLAASIICIMYIMFMIYMVWLQNNWAAL